MTIGPAYGHNLSAALTTQRSSGLTAAGHIRDYVPANGFSIRNMTWSPGVSPGVYTSGGEFAFDVTAVESWANKLQSDIAYPRVAGRTLEWGIDLSRDTTPWGTNLGLFVGFHTGVSTQFQYQQMPYGVNAKYHSATQWKLEIWESGLLRAEAAVPAADRGGVDDRFSARIVLRETQGADYFYARNNGPWQYFYASNHANAATLYPTINPNQGRHTVRNLHIYDQPQMSRVQGLAVGTAPVSANVNSDERTTYYGVDDTSSARTITLQSAHIAVDGWLFIIKDESGGAGTNAISIATEGSEMIDALSAFTIGANYGSVTMIARGGNLRVLASYTPAP